MKQFLYLFCLLAVLLSGCSASEQTSAPGNEHYTLGTYQLTFHEKKLSNDHVGNEWSFTYSHNGQIIQSGYEITLPLKSRTYQSIDVEIREKDKIDDIGTGTLTIAIREGATGKTEIAVTETNGRYKGNTAVWEFSYEVSLVKRQ